MTASRPALLICIASLLAPACAFADAELARKRICLGCHDLQQKKVGPAFRDIARRYAGQPDASARMADKIVHGSAGAWGAVPMPANPKVTPDEARVLANWLLAVQ